MPIFYGSRLYGKVDHVPGLFYVVTRFFHVQFIPMFPDGSYLIFDDGCGTNNVALGNYPKSILMTYVRLTLGVTAVVSGLFLLIGLADWFGGAPGYGDDVMARLFVTVPASIVLFWLTHRLTRGTEARAVWFAQEFGLDQAFGLDAETIRAFFAARARGEQVNFWTSEPEPDQPLVQLPPESATEHFRPSQQGPFAVPPPPKADLAAPRPAAPEGATRPPGDESAPRPYP